MRDGRAPRRARRRVGTAVLVAVLVAALGGPAGAVSTPSSAAGGAGAPASSGSASLRRRLGHLVAQARRDGSVRVIVDLRVPFTPERRLRSVARARQRRLIGVGQDALEDLVAPEGGRVVHRFATVPAVALRLPVAAVTKLWSSPMVADVEPDTPEPVADAESTPLVGATQAVADGIDGSGTAVAILDTGVDSSHPYLGGRVVAEACYSAAGNCPDGSTSEVGPGAGVPCTYAGACQHGTHVAGIAAGRHEGAATFDGVAPGASLISVQVFSRFTGSTCSSQGESPCALSYVSDQILGLEHVYELGASVDVAAVNMSLGGGPSTTPCASDARADAIANLRAAGIATVVASGNDGSSTGISAPACAPDAVSVGATNKDDTVASYSNSASFLSLLAPGTAIESSVPGGGFAVLSGTSMATPHVSGAFALLKEARPSWDVDTTVAVLRSVGPALTDARNGVVTHRLDVAAALALRAPGPPAVDPATPADGAISVSWAAPVDDGGSPVTGYVVTVQPGDVVREVGAGTTSTMVTGLVAGAPVTVSVAARNLVGTGPAAGVAPVTPTTTIQPRAVAVAEGDVGTTIAPVPVHLTAPSASTVTVAYRTLPWSAAAGVDFVETSGVVTFAPGQTDAAAPVPVVGDTLSEADESAFLVFSDPVGGALGGFGGLGFLTIHDDDPLPALVPGSSAVAEGDSGTRYLQVPVRLSAPSGRYVSVSFRSVDFGATAGSDYGAVSGTLVFPPGVTLQRVWVPVYGDTVPEPDESLLVILSDAHGATIGGFAGVGGGTILDDD